MKLVRRVGKNFLFELLIACHNYGQRNPTGLFPWSGKGTLSNKQRNEESKLAKSKDRES